MSGYPVNCFESRPPDDLICGLCLDILNDPHQCKNGHMFCYGCIKEALKTRQKCPTCNMTQRENDFGRCLYVKNVVNELSVKCCFDDDGGGGCGWTGKLPNLLIRKCPFKYSKCPLGCDELVANACISEHNAICVMRIISCPYCSEQLHEKNYIQHMSLCSVKCKHCRHICLSSEMAQHRRLECSHRWIPCPLFGMNGCGVSCSGFVRLNTLDDHFISQADGNTDKLREMRAMAASGGRVSTTATANTNVNTAGRDSTTDGPSAKRARVMTAAEVEVSMQSSSTTSLISVTTPVAVPVANLGQSEYYATVHGSWARITSLSSTTPYWNRTTDATALYSVAKDELGRINSNFLGRSPYCHFQFVSIRISNKHCTIFCLENRADLSNIFLEPWIEDLSSNGTFIKSTGCIASGGTGGKLIQLRRGVPRKLKDNDEIYLIHPDVTTTRAADGSIGIISNEEVRSSAFRVSLSLPAVGFSELLSAPATRSGATTAMSSAHSSRNSRSNSGSRGESVIPDVLAQQDYSSSSIIGMYNNCSNSNDARWYSEYSENNEQQRQREPLMESRQSRQVEPPLWNCNSSDNIDNSGDSGARGNENGPKEMHQPGNDCINSASNISNNSNISNINNGGVICGNSDSNNHDVGSSSGSSSSEGENIHVTSNNDSYSPQDVDSNKEEEQRGAVTAPQSAQAQQHQHNITILYGGSSGSSSSDNDNTQSVNAISNYDQHDSSMSSAARFSSTMWLDDNDDE